jgi:hypothetical protein
MGFGIGAHSGSQVPSKGDLKRLARKGKKFSHYDRFDKLLDERKHRNVRGNESKLFYRMYRAKKPKRRRAIKKYIHQEYPQNNSGGNHSQLSKGTIMKKALQRKIG